MGNALDALAEQFRSHAWDTRTLGHDAHPRLAAASGLIQADRVVSE